MPDNAADREAQPRVERLVERAARQEFRSRSINQIVKQLVDERLPGMARRFRKAVAAKGAQLDNYSFGPTLSFYEREGRVSELLDELHAMSGLRIVPNRFNLDVLLRALELDEAPETLDMVINWLREVGVQFEDMEELPATAELVRSYRGAVRKRDAAHIVTLFKSASWVPTPIYAHCFERFALWGAPEATQELLRGVAPRQATKERLPVLIGLAAKPLGIEGKVQDVEALRHLAGELGVTPTPHLQASVRRAYVESGQIGSAEVQLIDAAARSQLEELAILFEDVVHELQQPVATVGALTTTLLRRVHRGDDVDRDLVEQLSKAVGQLGDRMSEYKALTRGRESEDLIDLQRLFDEVESLINRRFPDAPVEYHVVPNPKRSDALVVKGDRFFLHLALRGLVTNAIQAVEEVDRGAKVEVVASPGPDRWIDVVVKDNGPGVPRHLRDEIFKKGFSTKPGRGLGIGLSLVESVIAAHGGTMQLLDPPVGAHFQIRLPGATSEGEPQ